MGSRGVFPTGDQYGGDGNQGTGERERFIREEEERELVRKQSEAIEIRFVLAPAPGIRSRCQDSSSTSTGG